MLRSLVSLLAPPACLACGGPAEGPLCRGCRGTLVWLADPCPRCGLPRPCGPPCPAARAAFAGAWAPVAYGGAAKALVLALKARGRTAAADAMAAMIAANAPRALLAGGSGGDGAAAARPPAATPGGGEAAVLVPVPADPARRRARGLDHAGLLARALARRSGLVVARPLARDGTSTRQMGAPLAARLRGPRVVARAAAPALAVLVDDVHTTGATLHACARALREAGAAEVRAVTYARTLR